MVFFSYFGCMRLALSLTLLLALSFTSCTIKKRVYRPGYHIVWKKKAHTSGNDSEASNKKNITPKSGGSTSTAQTTPEKPQEKSNDKKNETTLSEYTEQVKKQKHKKPATKDVSSTPAGQKR